MAKQYIDNGDSISSAEGDEFYPKDESLYKYRELLNAIAAGEVELVQPATETLANAQSVAISAAASSCDAALTPYAARFGVLERETWSAQLAEATALLADPTLPASSYPTISGIIAVTGEAAADFAAAVQKNNETWLAIAANAAGQRQKIVAQIKAITAASESAEDVAAAVAAVKAIDTTITISVA